MVNTGKSLDTKIIKQEIKEEKPAKPEIENTYQKTIVTDIDKREKDHVQMEEWSILSYHVKYVTHDGS